jgi:hypothetical protein
MVLVDNQLKFKAKQMPKPFLRRSGEGAGFSHSGDIQQPPE